MASDDATAVAETAVMKNIPTAIADTIVTDTVTEKMLEEEMRLAEERAKKEAEEEAALLKAAPNMDESSFSKLDQLLSQTKIYSQFLLERMDDIAMVRLALTLFPCIHIFAMVVLT